MTSNQKILLGCGGAGCLGIIVAVVVIFGVVGYKFNQISGRMENSNSSQTNNGGISEDERHRLFQAASAVRDEELKQRVMRRIGLLKDDGTPSDNMLGFAKDHIVWAFKNGDFIKQINSPEAARDYINTHLPPDITPSSLPSSTNSSEKTAGSLNDKAISLPKPVYPPLARTAHAEGTVIVEVTVDETGKVTSAKATSGHPLLRASAEQAARQARFKPTIESGRAVPVTGTISYDFKAQ